MGDLKGQRASRFFTTPSELPKRQGGRGD